MYTLYMYNIYIYMRVRVYVCAHVHMYTCTQVHTYPSIYLSIYLSLFIGALVTCEGFPGITVHVPKINDLIRFLISQPEL